MTTDLVPVPPARSAAKAAVRLRTADRLAFRLHVPPVSGVVRPRLLAVSLLLAGAAFLAFAVETSVGDIDLPLADVLKALVARATPAPN